MIFIFYSALIGLVLGALSAYHAKAFISALISSLFIGGLIMRPVIIAGAAASSAMGKSNIFGVYLEGITMLPVMLKMAVLLLPIFFFAGRLLAWAYKSFLQEDYVETKVEQRARVLREHKWTTEKDKSFSSKIKIRR